MGLLDNTTQKDYYRGDDHGNYQFTSLKDIVSSFMIAYVGENKIIRKVKRADVIFHAKRALQEFSFDTFKSVKAQEIEIPPTLTMILPHDYVNYVKVAWSDAAGIEHIMYPASKTSNPTNITQDENGEYLFVPDLELGVNRDFSSTFQAPWYTTPIPSSSSDTIKIVSGVLEFAHNTVSGFGIYSGNAYAVWQAIDVSESDSISISATGTSASSTGTVPDGILRFGISSTLGDQLCSTASTNNPTTNNLINPGGTIGPNFPTTVNQEPGYVEWNDGSSSTKTIDHIDVSAYDTVYIFIASHVAFIDSTSGVSTNKIDDISVTNDNIANSLQTSYPSDSWTSYKSLTAKDNINRYDDGTYDLVPGERYGIDPQHAQVNGSFYIDENTGKIHFSSNVNGKTIVLRYISDGLGTDKEMRVHKFAEEAMYKWIICAIMSTTPAIPEFAINRYKKEKRAAIRQAKLRLSNIKLEEIVQILRGKSKRIKH